MQVHIGGSHVKGRIGIVIGIAVFMALPVLAIGAQGAVSGRVTIQEKPGETTSDLANAVIYLVPKVGTARFSEQKTQMAMSGRQFSPRIRVVTPGSTLEYPNQDPFSHNIFSTAPGAAFDLGVYGSNTSKSTTFKKAGAFPVYCNIHAKMTAYVVVVATPYYGQPTADGRWSLPSVPAGKYELHVWHERAPELIKAIDLTASGMAGVDATLDAKGFTVAEHKNKFGQKYSDIRY
jgi:plastocyanin